jgi:hypothetical protein
VVSLVIGLLLIGVVVEDVIATTLTLGEGTGPLTRRVLRLAWRGLFGLQRRRGGRKLLGNAGALLLAVTVMIWVALFWGGWSLVFLGSGTVIDASTGERASALDVVYYAGYAVFTLGVGDFVADEAGWRVMTFLASFSGLVLVTFTITYLFSVVSAVVSRRAVATQIHCLGDSAEDILVRGWDGGSFSPAFTSHLIALSAQLASVAEQHLAYPVLHYFRSREARASAPVAASRLDNAVVLLEAAVAQPARPSSRRDVPIAPGPR